MRSQFERIGPYGIFNGPFAEQSSEAVTLATLLLHGNSSFWLTVCDSLSLLTPYAPVIVLGLVVSTVQWMTGTHDDRDFGYLTYAFSLHLSTPASATPPFGRGKDLTSFRHAHSS